MTPALPRLVPRSAGGWTRAVLLGATYLVLARLGSGPPLTHEGISLLWPAAGVGFAALLIWGEELWIGILAAVFVSYLSTRPLGGAVAGALVNAGGLAAGAWLYRTLARPGIQLDGVRNVALLAVIGGLAGTVLGALAAAAVLYSTGAPPGALVFSVNWIGRGLAVLIVVPAVLAWSEARPRGRWQLGALTVALATTLTLAVFVAPVPLVVQLFLLGGLAIPLQLVAASRFGRRGATAATLAFACAVVVGLDTGTSPLHAGTAEVTAFAHQVMLLGVALSNLVIAAAQAERTTAMAELDASRRRMLRLFTRSPVAVVEWNAARRVTAWNPAAEALFGLPEAMAVGRDGIELLATPEERPRAEEVARQVLEGRQTVRAVLHIGAPQGREVTCEWHGTPLTGPAGEVIGAVWSGLDLTERIALEEQLRQAVKLDAIGKLAGGIAHDFNNLLTAVEGHCAHLDLELPAGSPLREEVSGIREASARAAGLTRQLLTFSRKQATSPRVVDLTELTRRMEQMLRRLLGAEIRFAVHVAGDPVPVRADPSQLEQVLLNLVVNARDAMPGGGALDVAADAVVVNGPTAARLATLRPGPYARLVVRDTGHGMDAATRARIFDPFFSTKPPGEGTGLGLSTVYGIVTQQGGHVEVESAPGRGTAFTVYLPLADGEVEPLARPGATRLPGGTETILVAEDEDAVRRLTRRALEQYGYRVIEAVDGLDALRVEAEVTGPIHLLLSDVVMPNLNGVGLAREFRARRPDTRILLTSGYTGRELDGAGDHAPAPPLLPKPFTVDELLLRVRVTLDAAP